MLFRWTSRIAVGQILLAHGCTTSGEGDTWLVEDVRLSEDDLLHYVDVAGKVTLQDEFGAGVFGADATVSFYSDEYQTLIDSIDRSVGDDLETEGDTQQFSLGSLEVWLLPSSNGQQKVCAELTVDESNYGGEPQEVGCLEASGTRR